MAQMALSLYFNKKHNECVLEELEVGDMVEFPNFLYSHWGVYIGDEHIVHLTGDEATNAGASGSFASGSFFNVSGVLLDKACVKIDHFLKVAEGCMAKRNNGKDHILSAAGIYPRPSDEIVRTALALRSEADYDIFSNNCEHFASYLRYGAKWSDQADLALGTVLIGGAAVVIGSLLRSFFQREK
ncbi:HRAS-like suppressor 2 [Mizuhopecten yessoensis]|uniref:HRAS-like suppressor 2 n=1 Tax=Mizuhopecten yessoensis TaxID=6573 RepID=A0A210PLT6_MIZYE|nr:HRAS-like suppressor 2 [Mizuhopecten yessoensis]XP_021380316.1 HRAS-like suppressor 2 [Mizuhopecten yessoensis]OWF37445.1 HRAS-like suppressor 2 [Mizuhopecten yessoensis]